MDRKLELYEPYHLYTFGEAIESCHQCLLIFHVTPTVMSGFHYWLRGTATCGCFDIVTKP